MSNVVYYRTGRGRPATWVMIVADEPDLAAPTTIMALASSHRHQGTVIERLPALGLDRAGLPDGQCGVSRGAACVTSIVVVR